MQERHARMTVTIVWILACVTGVVLLFINVPGAAAAYADGASESDVLLSIRLRRLHRVLWIAGAVMTAAWVCWSVITRSGMRRVVVPAAMAALTLGLWVVARTLPWQHMSFSAWANGSTVHYLPEVRDSVLFGNSESGATNVSSTTLRFWLHTTWLPLLSVLVLGLAWSRRFNSNDSVQLK